MLIILTSACQLDILACGLVIRRGFGQGTGKESRGELRDGEIWEGAWLRDNGTVCKTLATIASSKGYCCLVTWKEGKKWFTESK